MPNAYQAKKNYTNNHLLEGHVVAMLQVSLKRELSGA